MKFSIIIPVYNVETYLKECLDSVLSQDFFDYEVLLINDGSTDGSPIICEEYAKKFNQIRYYSKQNGGLSDTRNYGLDHSNGEYCIFLDSDDWIKNDSLTKIAKVIKNTSPDVIVTKLIEVYPDEIKDKDFDFNDYLANGFDKEKALLWNFNHSRNPWPAQKTIVSKRFIDHIGLRFLVGRIHEDLDWTSHLFLNAETFEGLKDEWYYHRLKREGSITSIQKAKNFIDTIEIAKNLYDEMAHTNNPETNIILRQVMRSVYGKLNQINKCSENDLKEIAVIVEKNKSIYSIAPSLKYKLFSICINVLGAERALRILKAIK